RMSPIAAPAPSEAVNAAPNPPRTSLPDIIIATRAPQAVANRTASCGRPGDRPPSRSRSVHQAKSPTGRTPVQAALSPVLKARGPTKQNARATATAARKSQRHRGGGRSTASRTPSPVAAAANQNVQPTTSSGGSPGQPDSTQFAAR